MMVDTDDEERMSAAMDLAQFTDALQNLKVEVALVAASSKRTEDGLRELTERLYNGGKGDVTLIRRDIKELTKNINDLGLDLKTSRAAFVASMSVGSVCGIFVATVEVLRLLGIVHPV